ncbi:N-acetylmuramic acid 6-phosphate etherase [Rickettsiales bacterium LUAb2]
MNKIDLTKIATETRNSNTLNIDTLDTLGIVSKINQEDQKVALAVEKELPSIAAAIDVITNAFTNNARLVYLGAGTSGRIGILDASECPPTYGVSTEMVKGLIAGGKIAILESVENAEDKEELAIDDLKAINFTKNDVLVGLAASGRTPYVIGGINYAKSLGANTVAIACSKNSAIGAVADIKIEVEVGPEVITGSTRMKAGTAQKMVVNMLTTASMIKIGKVYSNLMIDVQPLNAKLIERCKAIFMEATGASYSDAETYLAQSKNNVKLAVLMKQGNVNLEQATNLLKVANFKLNDAIKLALSNI